MVESKRRGLDPIALTAIAYTESRYRYWVTLPRDKSYGVWQIMPHDVWPKRAVKLLSGCKPGPSVPDYWIKWQKRQPPGRCEDQYVADQRRKAGRFSKRELMDPYNVISTYVAAYEINGHQLWCQKRRHKPHLYNTKACLKLSIPERTLLGRYSHFNSGWRKPRRRYVNALCKHYHMIKTDIYKMLKRNQVLDGVRKHGKVELSSLLNGSIASPNLFSFWVRGLP